MPRRWRPSTSPPRRDRPRERRTAGRSKAAGRTTPLCRNPKENRDMRKLRNLTVQKKLLGGFAVAAAVFGVVTTFTLLKMSGINADVAAVRSDDQLYAHIVQSGDDIRAMTSNTLRALLFDSPTKATELKNTNAHL